MLKYPKLTLSDIVTARIFISVYDMFEIIPEVFRREVQVARCHLHRTRTQSLAVNQVFLPQFLFREFLDFNYLKEKKNKKQFFEHRIDSTGGLFHFKLTYGFEQLIFQSFLTVIMIKQRYLFGSFTKVKSLIQGILNLLPS